MPNLSTQYGHVHSVLLQGTLFPMCGMNLAFNRELIGPAMYFGLMGDGQPLGRYDDMWAGWCSKVGRAHQFADRSSFFDAFVRLKHSISVPDDAAVASHHQAAVFGRSSMLSKSARPMRC